MEQGGKSSQACLSRWTDEASSYGGTKTIHLVDVNFKP